MGDEDDRLAQLLLDPEQLVLEPRARDRIERAEGLVHQHQRRIRGERAGEPDTLALAARAETRSGSGSRGGQVDEVEQLVRAQLISRFDQPSSRGTVATFSATVMCGKSPTCWIT